MKNIEVELYLNQFVNFFDKNPNDLIDLIGDSLKEDFYKKVESYSIEELSDSLEIERPEIRRNSTLITPDHAATPEAQEYTRKLHQLITGKTL